MTENLCKNCTLCCYGAIILSEKDYENLPDKSFAIPIINIENFQHLISEPIKYIIDTPDNVPCPFLDIKNSCCSIYDNRPELCRNFPLINIPKSKYINENCILLKSQTNS